MNKIYIIIIIAWVIYSFIKKTKKQQAKQAQNAAGKPVTQPVERAPQKSAASILEELLLGTQTMQRQPVFQPEYQPEGYDSLEIIEEEIDNKKNTVEGFVKAEDRIVKPLPVAINQHHEGQKMGVFTIDDGFDMRKAVIYSEILNRPYN